MKRFGREFDGLAIFFDRLFPTFLNLPNGARPGFVIGLLVVIVFRIVDLLFAVARGGVVRIDS